MISESEIRNWADEQGVFSSPAELRDRQAPMLR